MRVTADPRVCQRSFPRHGHFETLLELGSVEDLASLEEKEGAVEPRQSKGWRYAPFVQTGYGHVGVKDLVEIQSGASDASTRELQLLLFRPFLRELELTLPLYLFLIFVLVCSRRGVRPHVHLAYQLRLDFPTQARSCSFHISLPFHLLSFS